MTNNLAPIDRFDGDFDFLPLAAHVRYGQIPKFPSSGDFQSAVCLVVDDLDKYVEAHWYLEATRERILHPGRALDDAKRDINGRVASRLHKRTRGL
jgi:hypothetical protein